MLRRPLLYSTQAIRVLLILWACAALACGTPTEPSVSKEDSGKVTSAVKQAAKDKEQMFDEEGVPLPAKEEVLGAPVPKRTWTQTADRSGAAGFTSNHTFDDLVKFYDKRLDDRFKREDARGGVRFADEKSGMSIYILKANIPGRYPRVMYFRSPKGGKGVDIPDIPSPEEAKRAVGIVDDEDPGATSPTASSGASSAKPNAEGQSKSSAYRRTVERGADGKEVVVLTPTNPTLPTGRTSKDNADKGPSRVNRAKIPIKKGAVF